MATIAFVGGTGPEGLGLAMRLARAGESVRIGSRRPERASEAVTKVRDALTTVGATAGALGADVAGGLNAEVVAAADIVVVVVPFGGHAAILTDLRDTIGSKLVIDAVVPLTFRKGVPGVVDVPEGSATEQAQALLPEARVVGAFHNLSAVKLQALGQPLTGDVLVTAADDAAKEAVLDLVGRIPNLRGVDAGPLSASKFVEDITALLLGINRRYKSHAAVQIVGL